MGRQKVLNLLGLLFFACLLNTQAQQVYDRWCFNHNLGIDFTSNGAVFNANNSIESFEGCISVCDVNGKLLFYASPTTVWDSMHNVMPNGDSLHGHISAKLGVFSVPVPESPQRHYVFTSDAAESWPSWETRYSIVNMALNSGLGDLEPGSKNTLLFDHNPHIAESVIGCSMAGQTDGYWIFCCKGNEIHIFKITANGISSHSSYQTDLMPIGASSLVGVSGSGRRFIMNGFMQIDSVLWRGFTLLKFDPVLGAFNDELFIPLSTNIVNTYAEFSPNEKFLYFNHFESVQNISYALSLNLNIWDEEIILNSIDTLGVLDSNRLFQFKLGVNDTIYINRDLDSNMSIATIGNPDQVNGPAVFDPISFPVQLNIFGQHGPGLPNNLQYGKPDFEARYTCLGDSTWFVFFGLADSLKWNFNDPNAGMLNFSMLENPYFLFSYPDTFSVELIVYYKNNIDTINHEVIIKDTLPDHIFVLEDAFLCGNADSVVFDFSALNPTEVLWSDSVNTLTRIIKDTGNYAVLIANECDTIRDTLEVIYQLRPNLSLKDTTICADFQLVSGVNNPPTNNIWSTGDTTASITIDTSLSPDLSPLDIWLTATNVCGTVSDTMTIDFLPIPNASLPADSSHCLDQSFFIFHENFDNVNYLWSDSTSEGRFRIDSTQSVWLIAENICGVDRDTFNVEFYPEIKPEHGEDTVICNGEILVLDATWPGANYAWNTGSTGNSITVSETDNYIVTISSPPCQKVVSRTVSFTEEACNESGCKFSIPNVFSPNADGINDALRITNTCEHLNFTVFIYNRWGQLVFRQQNSSSGASWDGTINGEAATEGTYFVVAMHSEEKTQRAAVSLMR